MIAAMAIGLGLKAIAVARRTADDALMPRLDSEARALDELRGTLMRLAQEDARVCSMIFAKGAEHELSKERRDAIQRMRELPMEILTALDAALRIHEGIYDYVKPILVADVKTATELLCADAEAQLANMWINMQSIAEADARSAYGREVLKYRDALDGHISRAADAIAKRWPDYAYDRKGNGQWIGG